MHAYIQVQEVRNERHEQRQRHNENEEDENIKACHPPKENAILDEDQADFIPHLITTFISFFIPCIIMSHAQCRYLLFEYVGQRSAAICTCDNDKDCPKRKGSVRKMSISCFNLGMLRIRPEGSLEFSKGEPTMQKPEAT